MTYLDFNATTPARPEALAAMAEAAREPGNPASLHAAGQAARRRLEAATREIAELVGETERARVVFTGSGSEASLLAIVGLARRAVRQGRRRVLLSAVEHPCVRAAGDVLRREGMEVAEVPVLPSGVIDLGTLATMLGDDVAVVAVMLANNETGVLEPVAEVARLASRCGAAVHTDAVQAAGKVPVSMPALGVDSLALAAHKLGGPKGIGALVLAPGVELEPLWDGGGQQHGVRPGTPPVTLAVGFAAAAVTAARDLGIAGHGDLRDALEAGARALDAFVIGADAPRLPNTTALGFAGVPAARLVESLSRRGIMVGAGAACHTGDARPSPVLTAMGVPRERALEVTRFSTGWTTSSADVGAALEALASAIDTLRRAA